MLTDKAEKDDGYSMRLSGNYFNQTAAGGKVSAWLSLGLLPKRCHNSNSFPCRL